MGARDGPPVTGVQCFLCLDGHKGFHHNGMLMELHVSKDTHMKIQLHSKSGYNDE